MKKRNVAIIAHVDHGKTTIVNEILKESIKDKHLDLSTISMDNNSIERERGITILAKPTSIEYKGYKINILDTPGHADFGGEVERIMNMVDGVILVVDSYEGTMPQTRFVLKKALERGAKPIVVINKVDKESARIKEVVDEVYELFMDLDANEDQLDFKIIYTSAINGTSSLSDDLTKQEKGFHNLLDTIIEEIPEPKGSVEANLQFQPALLDYSDYTGRIGIGIVKNGVIKLGQTVEVERIDGSKKQFRIQKLYGYEFLNRIDDVVCFESLSKEQLHQILEILVKNTNNALKNRNIFVELTDKAKEFVVEKGTDLKNGARPLRRAVQRYIEDTVTDGIFNEQIQDRRYCKIRY